MGLSIWREHVGVEIQQEVTLQNQIGGVDKQKPVGKLDISDWTVYRNRTFNGDVGGWPSPKSIEFRLPPSWTEISEAKEPFDISLSVESPDSQHGLLFYISHENEFEYFFRTPHLIKSFEDYLAEVTDLRPLPLEEVDITGVQREEVIDLERFPEADPRYKFAAIIETHIQVEPYVYSFYFMEGTLEGRSVCKESKELNDAILSTFRILN